MKILLSIVILLTSVNSYSEMEEFQNVVRTKIQKADQVSKSDFASEDKEKIFYNNILKRLHLKNPKASKTEIVQKAEPLWYQYLEIEKSKTKRRPALSNELDVKIND